jgi:hypothetical protein
MTSDEFMAELDRGYNWRFDEVRRLKNLITLEPDPERHEEFRKSLVVVLYAHFEGFCIFALEHYLNAVNRSRVSCRDVVPSLLAGSWEPLFNAMEHGDEKCKIFRQALPNDANLHRQWRRRHFVEELDRFLRLPVKVPEDVIDSESNLKPQVLQRNLFLLGLDHRFVDSHSEVIHNLLGRRNRIAHGDDRRGVPEREYNDYESSVFEICYRLIEFLNEAYTNQRYRRERPEYVV